MSVSFICQPLFHLSLHPFIYSSTAYHPLVWSMPSAMKSAGKVSSNSFLFSKGQWTWAQGMLPLSNQQSNTSVILRSMPLPHRDGIVRLSMLGRESVEKRRERKRKEFQLLRQMAAIPIHQFRFISGFITAMGSFLNMYTLCGSTGLQAFWLQSKTMII